MILPPVTIGLLHGSVQVYQAELLSGNKNHSEYLNQKRNLMHEIRNIEINERLEQQAPGWRNGFGSTVPNWPCSPPSGRWPLDRSRNAWLQEQSTTSVTQGPGSHLAITVPTSHHSGSWGSNNGQDSIQGHQDHWVSVFKFEAIAASKSVYICKQVVTYNWMI